jgi:hypothetical protein
MPSEQPTVYACSAAAPDIVHVMTRMPARQDLRSTFEEAGGKVDVDVQRRLRDGDPGRLRLRLGLLHVGVVQDVLAVLQERSEESNDARQRRS